MCFGVSCGRKQKPFSHQFFFSSLHWIIYSFRLPSSRCNLLTRQRWRNEWLEIAERNVQNNSLKSTDHFFTKERNLWFLGILCVLASDSGAVFKEQIEIQHTKMRFHPRDIIHFLPATTSIISLRKHSYTHKKKRGQLSF